MRETRGPRDVEQDGLPGRRPAPLENIHAQLPARAVQLQAQGCGRSLGRQSRGAEAKRPAAALARRHVQAAQTVGGQASAKQGIEPEQRGRHAAAAQGFDPGPQRVARPARKHQAQAVETNSGSSPGRRMDAVRRRDQHHHPAGSRQRRQRRQQEAELADSLAFCQQFGQGPARPAAAGQFGVESGKAGGKSRRWRYGESIAAPDVGALE